MISSAKIFSGALAAVLLGGCATNRYAHLPATMELLHQYEPISPDPGPAQIEKAIRAYASFTGFSEWIGARRYASGDLDGDEKADVVVITCFQSTGTWAIQVGFVALSSNRRRCLTFEAGELIDGSRWGDSAEIENEQIVITGHRHRLGDLHGYPSMPATFWFRVKDGMKVDEEPNKALEPTPGSVADRAGARSAPAPVVAHL